MRELALLLGAVAGAAAVILGIFWASGAFMHRGCEKTERQEVRLWHGPDAIVDVCVGEWR